MKTLSQEFAEALRDEWVIVPVDALDEESVRNMAGFVPVVKYGYMRVLAAREFGCCGRKRYVHA